MKVGIDYPGISVVFFCHDGNGNFLMNRRSINCRDEYNRWDIGAGAVRLYENVTDTLIREIKEEYCTDILDYEFLGYRDIHRESNGIKTHWVTHDFKVLIDNSLVGNGEPHKFDEIGWFKLDKLPFPLHSQLPNFLGAYRNKL
ncbi:NUDIX domain protein [uncultured archaeon]|nr:NUDIX domain protein [uncultured archaeon]